jgi:hypothetical protein
MEATLGADVNAMSAPSAHAATERSALSIITLLDQSPPAGANRDTQRHLTVTGRPTRDQQAGDVRARYK